MSHHRKNKKQGKIYLLYVILAILGLVSEASAKDKDPVTIIADFAATVCGSVPLDGGSSGMELSADGKAALKGLTKKLADLGVQAAAKYKKDQHNGVLQKDLPEILKLNTNCKVEVTKYLGDKLLQPKRPPQVIHSPPGEITLVGAIWDEDDRPVNQALVQVPKCGVALTDNYGKFEIYIPNSKKSKIYEGTVILEGYRLAHFAVDGPAPRETLNITLTKKTYPVEDFIRPPSYLMVGHYLGMPQLDLILHFSNPTKRTIKLSDISMIAIGPQGDRYEIPMIGTFSPIGIYNPMPLTILELNASQDWQLGYRFFKRSAAVDEVFHYAQLEYPPTKPVPAFGENIFSQEMAERFTNLMTKEMVWRAGTWELLLSTRLENRDIKRSFYFNLTNEDIAKFKSVSRFYRTGYSTLPTLPAAPDGSSLLSKTLVDQKPKVY